MRLSETIIILDPLSQFLVDGAAYFGLESRTSCTQAFGRVTSQYGREGMSCFFLPFENVLFDSHHRTC